MTNGDAQAGEPVESGHISDHVVTRDATFCQFYADAALSVRAPRTLELAFLKIGSILTQCSVNEGNDTPDSFKMAPEVREVGRATLPIAVATTLALDILEEVAPSGLIDAQLFRSRMYQLVELADASSKSQD